MDEEKFKDLQRGDIIKNRGSHKSYVITNNYGKIGIVAVRTLLATNAGEWDKVN